MYSNNIGKLLNILCWTTLINSLTTGMNYIYNLQFIWCNGNKIYL